MRSDIQIYTDYMAEVRARISVVQALLDGRISTGIEGLNTEVIFLQLRKTLEVIAFASLSANKDAYSFMHANFAEHWNAKKMQGAMEKVNAHYYPEPIEIKESGANGVKQVIPLTGDFLTKEDFVHLYDICSEVLHKQNPYSSKDPSIDTKLPLAAVAYTVIVQTDV